MLVRLPLNVLPQPLLGVWDLARRLVADPLKVTPPLRQL
jgi:hypothetical protein